MEGKIAATDPPSPISLSQKQSEFLHAKNLFLAENHCNYAEGES